VTYDQMHTAELLTEPPTKSTAHMSHGERLDGVCQMLMDLEQLARQDGCIAAAWALEKLIAVAEQGPAHESEIQDYAETVQRLRRKLKSIQEEAAA
jgi:hypothetical protein